MHRPTHKILPSVDSGGYALNPVKGEFSVIKPVESTNEIVDPNLEDYPYPMGAASGNYTIYNLNTSLSGCTHEQTILGVKSFKYTVKNTPYIYPSMISQAIALKTNSSVVFSLYIFASQIYTYQLFIRAWSYPTISSSFGPRERGKGYWERKILFLHNQTATAGVVGIYLDEGSVGYIGALQAEIFDADEYYKYETSFIPDQKRAKDDYSGGRLFNLQDIGLIITGHQGLCMSEVSNTTTQLGLLDGSLYQNSRFQERKFSISGRILADSVVHINNIKKELLDLLTSRRVSSSGLIRLYYQKRDDRGLEIGYPRYIDCVYSSGLEGNPSGYGEDVTLSFVSPNSFFTEEKDNTIKFSASNVNQTATVVGNAPTYPIFTIETTSSITFTSITNVSTNKTVTFSSDSFTGTIEIDTNKGSFELNGIGLPGRILSGNLRDLAIVNGDNTVKAIYSNNSAKVYMTWKNNWFGID